ncbi:MAG TPA: alpha-amylase family glycosyl hydrolase [Syntrophales bacterium]|nr:alpha-amylase family glycosyl hydrolase [Syntrophales bacterium]
MPSHIWEEIKSGGIDAVWLMGIWQRSPVGKALLWQERAIREAFPAGISASPYCIRDYTVDEVFGGEVGLNKIRESLSKQGIRLILDFVPNHTAPDHPWTVSHPEFYVPGEGLTPEESILCGRHRLAKGRDPFFPPWPDVVQLNAFHEGYRQAATDALLNIARLCDGVRCDMAMLLLNEVFEQTWGNYVPERPKEEFWSQVIRAVKDKYPSFLFLAEVYWGREKDLLRVGFDYCYDKVLYDILKSLDVSALRKHLAEDKDYQDHLLRFLENHDEERAAKVFPLAPLKAANVVMATVPGALLFHHGQWEGRRIRVPVYAPELPAEEPDAEICSFYRWVASLKRREILRCGIWELLPPFQVWPDNDSGKNLMAWMWSYGRERLLVIVNYSSHPAQGRLPLPFFGDGRQEGLHLFDLATAEVYLRSVQELTFPGLFVALPPWGYHLFLFDQP